MQNYYRPSGWSVGLLSLCTALTVTPFSGVLSAQDDLPDPDTIEVVLTATRFKLPIDKSPSAITLVPAEEWTQRQTEQVANALETVPGLNVVQTGAPGQVTSVFTRGLGSHATQVRLDGVILNQGFANAFDFGALTTDGLAEIEVQRGPQSVLYGPSAMGGTIQLFSQQGNANRTTWGRIEGGSFATGREQFATSGKLSNFDYAFAAGQLDTANNRHNNRLDHTTLFANLGYQPFSSNDSHLRIGCITYYTLSNAGNPNTILNPRLHDHLKIEDQVYAPHFDLQLTDSWHHHLVLDYDQERQVNRPNEDGFLGPTWGKFSRYQLDYQNTLRITDWLTFTSGAFYENVFITQHRPEVSQTFGPQPRYIKDFTEDAAGFAQVAVTPFTNALLVAGGRYDSFNLFGGQWSYRVAGNYQIPWTHTTLRSSVATGFTPPTPQDRIFSLNHDNNLDPEHAFGYDAGFEQTLLTQLRVGANYFHNDLSNIIGSDANGNTFNLGSAYTEGVESYFQCEPFPKFYLRGNYTYLVAINTSRTPFNNQTRGNPLPRRPRHECFASASYNLWNCITPTLEIKGVFDNRDIIFPPPDFMPQLIRLEDYVLLRFLLDIAVSPNLHLFARVENLTDKRYQEIYGYPALPRGYFGGVALRF